MGGRIGNRIVQDGLVFYIDAANNKSFIGTGTTINDISKLNNNAVLVNGTIVNTINGIFTFDGTNDYIESPINLGIPSISASIWVNINSSGVFKTIMTNQFFLQSNPASEPHGFAIQQRNTNTVWVSIGQWGVGGDTISNIPYQLNTWFNISFTYDTSVLNVYMNGILYANTASTRVLGSSVLRIGKGAAAIPDAVVTEYFNGSLALPMVYNKVLTSSEVLQNYNATRKRFGL